MKYINYGVFVTGGGHGIGNSVDIDISLEKFETTEVVKHERL